jgi:CDP-diacylglycerol--glycerol-3-phosphate 3-phosphatidyltransferase
VSEPPARQKLTFRRFSGLDRSGPPPPATQPGQPLRPWTIPNAIGYVRLALLPVFLVLAWDTDGAGAGPAIVFAVIAYGDALDGMAARVTGQYSRMGAMLDPVIDRLLVICGVVVCWRFDLLPRWLLAILVAREALMLLVGPFALRRGVELKINWWGRWGVWPTMAALFFGLCGLRTLGAVLLAIGVVLLLIASIEYARAARAQLSGGQTST